MTGRPAASSAASTVESGTAATMVAAGVFLVVRIFAGKQLAGRDPVPVGIGAVHRSPRVEAVSLWASFAFASKV